MSVTMHSPPQVSVSGRRRRREHFSRSQIKAGQMEIQGQSYLYFSGNYSWFQGTINTDGESNYSIYGEIMDITPNAKSKFQSSSSLSNSSTGSSTPYESDDEELNLDNGPQQDDGQFSLFLGSSNSTTVLHLNLKESMDGVQPSEYRITLTDHYTGIIYHFSKIIINHHAQAIVSSNESLLLSCDPNVSINFETQKVFKGQKAAMVIQKSLGNSTLLGKQSVVYAGEIHLEFSDDCIAAERNWSL